MTNGLTRQALYELVWSEPMQQLARRFSISDVGMAKACRRANIPVPPRGYWAKRQAGKSEPRPLLPIRGLGIHDVVAVGSSRQVSQEDELKGAISPSPQFSEDMGRVRERAEKLIRKAAAKPTLGAPHRAILQLMEQDAARREKQLTTSFSSIFDGPFFDSSFEKRRLRILNGLFVTLGRAGFRAWIRGKHAIEAGVQVGDQWVYFALDYVGSEEREERLFGPRKPPKKPDLALTIQTNQTRPPVIFVDESGRLLEERLREIAIELLVEGEQGYRDAIEWDYRWRLERNAALEKEARRQEEVRQRAERERLTAEQKARVDRLLQGAAALRQANEIRQYVEHVRRTGSPTNSTTALEDWASWALGEADRIDPIISQKFLADLAANH